MFGCGSQSIVWFTVTPAVQILNAIVNMLTCCSTHGQNRKYGKRQWNFYGLFLGPKSQHLLHFLLLHFFGYWCRTRNSLDLRENSTNRGSGRLTVGYIFFMANPWTFSHIRLPQIINKLIDLVSWLTRCPWPVAGDDGSTKYTVSVVYYPPDEFLLQHTLSLCSGDRRSVCEKLYSVLIAPTFDCLTSHMRRTDSSRSVFIYAILIYASSST